MCPVEPAAVAAPEVVSEAEESAEVNVDEVNTESSEDSLSSEASEVEMESASKMIKQLNLKVDGEEFIEELPFEVTPEQAEYLKKELQLSRMGQKRAQKSAEIEKREAKLKADLEEFLGELKNNPASILEQMGVDVKQMAENLMNEEIELLELTPEERRVRELEAQLEEIKAKEEAAKKSKEEAEFQALQDRYAADFEVQLTEAIDKGNLPKSPYIINQMVTMMSEAINSGIDVSFEDLIPIVQDSHQNEIRDRISGMSAEDLIGLISEKTLNDIIIKKAPSKKKVAPPTANTIVETGKTKEEKASAKFRTKSADDFFRNMNLR